MGLFSGLKDTYRKSEAAVVVQNLLAIQAKAGLLEVDPAKLANLLVATVWDAKPDVFSGKFDQRPYKITVAASALAYALVEREEHDPIRGALLISLGNILSELEVNGRLYPLTSLDHQLLEGAASIFRSEAGIDSKRGEPATQYGHNHTSFESWYEAYTKGVAETQPALAPDKDGKSLLEFMETEPLKRAFKDNVDPVWLGREFGKDFDLRTFGR